MHGGISLQFELVRLSSAAMPKEGRNAPTERSLTVKINKYPQVDDERLNALQKFESVRRRRNQFFHPSQVSPENAPLEAVDLHCGSDLFDRLSTPNNRIQSTIPRTLSRRFCLIRRLFYRRTAYRQYVRICRRIRWTSQPTTLPKSRMGRRVRTVVDGTKISRPPQQDGDPA
jgi:hypothetical protein